MYAITRCKLTWQSNFSVSPSLSLSFLFSFLFRTKRFISIWLHCRTTIIFRHPKTSDVGNVFLLPFTDDVWYMIIIVAIIYWLILLLTVKIELYFDNYPKLCTLDTNPASETALITTAAICQQGFFKIIYETFLFFSFFFPFFFHSQNNFTININ